MTDRNTFVWPPGTPPTAPEAWWCAAKYGGPHTWRMLGFMFHNAGGTGEWALAMYTDNYHLLQLSERDLN